MEDFILVLQKLKSRVGEKSMQERIEKCSDLWQQFDYESNDLKKRNIRQEIEIRRFYCSEIFVTKILFDIKMMKKEFEKLGFQNNLELHCKSSTSEETTIWIICIQDSRQDYCFLI